MDSNLKKQFKKLEKAIKESKNIVIASHDYPDGDAFGSVLALYLALRKENKIITPYLRNKLKSFSFLPGYSKAKSSFPKKADLFIGVDYGDFKRLGISDKKISEEKIITIDHHLPSDHRGTLKIIRSEFSSASEIIYSFFKQTGLPIDRDIAVCLLTGIYTDTGGFRHAVTSPKTMVAAADLMSCGASLLKIIKETITMESPLVLKIWGKVLSRIKQDKKTGMVYSWMMIKDFPGGIPENFSMGDLAADVSMRSGASFTLLLSESRKGEFKGSLRSEPHQNIDVAKIAKIFGGGGHRLSAGFETKGSIVEIVRKITREVLIK